MSTLKSYKSMQNTLMDLKDSFFVVGRESIRRKMYATYDEMLSSLDKAITIKIRMYELRDKYATNKEYKEKEEYINLKKDFKKFTDIHTAARKQISKALDKKTVHFRSIKSIFKKPMPVERK